VSLSQQRRRSALRKPYSSVAERYSIKNHETAVLILQDIDRYGGNESLAATWAPLVLSNQTITKDELVA
jgi:hypothetical protein